MAIRGIHNKVRSGGVEVVRRCGHLPNDVPDDTGVGPGVGGEDRGDAVHLVGEEEEKEEEQVEGEEEEDK